jgi:hypothetical protein
MLLEFDYANEKDHEQHIIRLSTIARLRFDMITHIAYIFYNDGTYDDFEFVDNDKFVKFTKELKELYKTSLDLEHQSNIKF